MSDPSWMRLALWVAKPYARRPDADDIRQIALVAAWTAVLKARASGGRWENRAAVQGAKWAIASYLRGDRCGDANRGPETVSLDDLLEKDDREWEPWEEDFAPGLIDQIGTWQAAERLLTAEEQAIVWAKFGLGQTERQIAARAGMSVTSVRRRVESAGRKLEGVMRQ